MYMKTLAVLLSCIALLMQSPAANSQTLSATNSGASASVIGPGDLLDISVFDTPEFSMSMRVNNDGIIVLPLIGDVKVGGLTPGQAGSRLEKSLVESGMVKTASVTVLITEYGASRVSALGEFKNPGMFPVIGQLRLLDLVSEAGGLVTDASGVLAVTHRDQQGSSETFRIGGHLPTRDGGNPLVQPGDTVVAEKAGIVYVVGAVHHPGGFVLQLDQSITLLKALALAEGPKSTAILKQACLIRYVDNKQQEIPINLKKLLHHHGEDQPMNDDDILYIPESAMRADLGKGLEAIAPAAAYAAVIR